jgi:hypothetical protein
LESVVEKEINGLHLPMSLPDYLPDFEKQINELQSPIFLNGCTASPSSNLASLYKAVLLIYSGGEGLLLGLQRQGMIFPLARSGSEGMKPYSWDLVGGVWVSKHVDSLVDALTQRPFIYRMTLSLEKEFLSLGEFQCPDIDNP